MAIRKVAFEFDPFDMAGVKVPRSRKREAQEAVAEFVKDEVLKRVGDGSSPVEGGRWKRALSPEYKKRKAEFSSAGYANMELHGDMLDALEVVPTRGGKLSLQIEGKQAPKADGHNNHSGESSLPPREFIPKRNQTFKRDIQAGIRSILKEFEEDEE